MTLVYVFHVLQQRQDRYAQLQHHAQKCPLKLTAFSLYSLEFDGISSYTQYARPLPNKLSCSSWVARHKWLIILVQHICNNKGVTSFTASMKLSPLLMLVVRGHQRASTI